MTLKSKSKVGGMHTKSRMELGCALMTSKSKTKVCGMHKKSIMELGCALMTLKSRSKVCGMHEKSRMELGCTLMTLNAGINLTGCPPPPRTSGLFHRNVCPAPGLLHNRKCPGAGPINDNVPGAGHLYQLALKHSYLGLKIKMCECPIGPVKVQNTQNVISNCLFALGP